MTKVCSKCNEEKPFGAFNAQKGKRHGLRSQCKECRKRDWGANKEEISRRRKEKYQEVKDLPETKAQQKASYKRNKSKRNEYRLKNKERENELKRIRYSKNREKIIARQKEVRNNNLERINERRRLHRIENLEQARAYEREYGKRRRERDIQFKLAGNLRTRINHALESRSESSQELLGCPIEHYCRHLESLFSPEMNWGNYGSYWSVDHIRPCASFDLTDPEQQKACFHWSNCQPLSKVENSKKGAKTGQETVYSSATPNLLLP